MPRGSDESERSYTLGSKDAAFEDAWFKSLSAWARRFVDSGRLPSDFSADCIQDLLLHALEQHERSKDHRAVTVRLTKDDVRKAAAKEYELHGHSKFTFDDANTQLQTSRGYAWLLAYLSTGPGEDIYFSDAELDAADARIQKWTNTAMKRLEKHLSETQIQALRLRYMSDRSYETEEIALLLGKSRKYIPKLLSTTRKQVKHLLADIIANRPLH